MSRSLVSLDVLANDCCGDIGDSNFTKKAAFTRHLLDGYRELHTFLTGGKEVKSVILSYDNVINLPNDFILLSKVGARRNPGGCIAILSLCDGVGAQPLSDTATCDYLNSVWDGNYGGGGYYFYNVWGAGTYYGELYGMGRGIINNGTYSLDASQGVLYIGGILPVDSEIIVEYISDGISNGVKYVPMELKLCLKFFAKWMYYLDKNPSLSAMNNTLYKKEYNKVQRFLNHRTPQQIAIAVNASISPTNY